MWNDLILPSQQVFALVCGYPSHLRRGRMLAMLHVYVDDSGINDTPIYALGGWVASVAQWASFSDEWAVAVKEFTPSVRTFKMKEAMGLNGQFHRVGKEDRDNLLAALGEIIERNKLVACSSVMDHSTFIEIIKPNSKRPADRAYFWLYYDLIGQVIGYLDHAKVDSPVDFTFDCQVMEQDRVSSAHTEFRKHASVLTGARLGALSFRPDDNFIPLQAADLSAWLCRHTHSVEKGHADQRDISWFSSRSIGWIDSEITEDHARKLLQTVTS